MVVNPATLHSWKGRVMEGRRCRSAGPLSGLLPVLLLGWVAAPVQAVEGATAGEVESTVCAACHEEQLLSYAGSVHSLFESAEWIASHPDGSGGGATGCNACHGDPIPHLDAGGTAGTIFAFLPTDLAAVKSAACQSCHRADHPRFTASAHAGAGLTCTDCHTIHRGDPRAPSLLQPALLQGNPRPFERGEPGTASCAGCHEDVFARFDLSERHPLREGALACTDCHDPHDRETRLRLGGFKQEACARCHAAESGPFVFEHGGQRVEGCVTCHEPHGTPNRHLLRFAQVAELCYSCHLLSPDFHLQFTPDTPCNGCHANIHGSNLDTDFFK